MLATRCHQELTRQKKGPGEGPEPLVPPGVLIPLGRACSLLCHGSECPLAVSSQWDGSALSRRCYPPVPTPPTHTDQAEDRASEWWGHLPLSHSASPWTRHPEQVSFLPARPGEHSALCTLGLPACLHLTTLVPTQVPCGN